MNTGKLLICTLVSTVFLFVLDGLWYAVLMKDYFDHSATERESPIWILLILGILVFSFFFCYMYPKGVEGSSKVHQGLRYGLLVAGLAFIPMAIIYYSTDSLMPASKWIVEIIYRIVVLAILGIIVAYLSGVPSLEADREGRTTGGGEGQDPAGGGGTATSGGGGVGGGGN